MDQRWGPLRNNSDQPRGQNNYPADVRGNYDQFIVSDSFYNSNGCLKEELFYKNPAELASRFQIEGLKSSALRNIYNSYLKFALRLKDGRISFEKAKEQFDIFFEERIVRQGNRKGSDNKPLLPQGVISFFEKHKSIARKDEKQMLGLFRYLTNIMCYFKG